MCALCFRLPTWVITSPVKLQIVYSWSIRVCFVFQTADLGLTENYGDSGYKFEIWFRRRSLGENYVLQAPNSEVKKMWVRDISKILWNQALKNRGTSRSKVDTFI